MSVISAIVSNVCTVHASDSFITDRQRDGRYKTREHKRPKIVRVPHFRGVMGYWGLALRDSPKWNTLEWLRHRAQSASRFSSPEEFARAIAVGLSQEFMKLKLIGTAGGIGIHFTAYEFVDGYWIPELFLISNWADTSYSALRPDGIGVSRETFHGISGEDPADRHSQPSYRHMVRSFLDEGKIITFNNGDPLLYNPAANGIFTMFQQLAARRNLADWESLATWCSLARRPVEIVCNVQRDFCAPDRRLVGGKPHDLAVTPKGEYISTTGD